MYDLSSREILVLCKSREELARVLEHVSSLKIE